MMDAGRSKYASRRDDKYNIQIQMHETLMKYLVSPAIVEYIEMKSAPLPNNVNTNTNTNTNKVNSFNFSKYGAHMIFNPMRRRFFGKLMIHRKW